MLIANPLYDVVFKYLLDDENVAKLFISAILGLEVNELALQPQEVPITFPRILADNSLGNTITVMRIDFKAKITLHTGEKVTVLIELQKAKIDSDVDRFRKYLGSQYSDSKNIEILKTGETIALPIISIYFLGYSLKNNPDVPIINIKRQYIDNYSQSVLNQKDDFIEGLTHDSIIVQIPALKKHRRNTLEKVLNIFDLKQNRSIEIDDYPSEYKAITNRLFSAIQDEIVRISMESEQAIFNDIEASMKREEVERRLKEEALNQKEEERKQKEEALNQKEEERKQKEEAINSLKSTIQALMSAGFSIEKIAEITNKSLAEIQYLIN